MNFAPGPSGVPDVVAAIERRRTTLRFDPDRPIPTRQSTLR